MRKEATHHITVMKEGKKLGQVDYYWITNKSIRVLWAETHDPTAWPQLWHKFRELPWIQFIYHKKKGCTKNCNKGACWKAHWRIPYAVTS